MITDGLAQEAHRRSTIPSGQAASCQRWRLRARNACSRAGTYLRPQR
jgi:hypothetical protein